MRTFLAFMAAFTPALALAQETADAAAVPAAGLGESPFGFVVPLTAFLLIFYFLLFRPQQKRIKEHQALLGALKKGDEVVTGGGIIGRITKISDADMMTVEIAKGVEVVVLKSTVNGPVSTHKSVAEPRKKSGHVRNDNVVPSRDSVANDN